MYRVISNQTAAVAAALLAKGYSMEKPFVPSESIVIRHWIELPLISYKYVSLYSILSIWPKGDRLFVRAQFMHKNPDICSEEEDFYGEILDNEVVEADYVNKSSHIRQGFEISYWLLDGPIGDVLHF